MTAVRHFCTYFDRRYLTRGLALHRSLERHGARFHLFVLALDSETADALRRRALPHVTVVALPELEGADPELRGVRPTRSLLEYYYTSTAAWALFLLEHRPEIEWLTYVDADLFFFGDPERLFADLGGGSVGLVEHRFPEHLRHLASRGRFNVGWVSFHRDDDGLACLRSWRRQCLDWCRQSAERERFADQKYLDAWPATFARVVVLGRPGAGLAPWNLGSHDVEVRGGKVHVDGEPLLFFHFHGLRQVGRDRFDPNLRGYGATPGPELMRALFVPYVRSLLEAEVDLAACGLDYAREAPLTPAGGGGAERALRDWLKGLRSALRGDLVSVNGPR